MSDSRSSVVVVTGAAHGIGRALARQLHARGDTVYLVDIDEDGLRQLSATMPGSVAYACDVSSLQSVTTLVSMLETRHRAVHLLINNAGISAAGPIESLDLAVFRRTMEINFWAPVYLCRALLPLMRTAVAEGQEVSICNVLSDFALFSLPTKAPYACSKHAVRAFTEALAAELAGNGIHVCAAYPGATATGLVERGLAVDAAKQAVEARFLEGGLAPEVVARRILRGVAARRARILIGRDTYFIDFASRLAPSVLQAGIRRFWRRVPFL